MCKKKTTEEFVSDARIIHGDKYDYSKVEYIQNKIHVCITCPVHGDFWQKPNVHLSGCGCPICKSEAAKRIRYGKGVNDVIGAGGTSAYQLWTNMLMRCYDNRIHRHRPAYSQVSVCDSWLLLSNFLKWFNDPENGYMDGYHLDKDIIIKNNKIYSPSTCCFVPTEINTLFTNRKRLRGQYPIGVSKKDGGFQSAIDLGNGKHKYLGFFNNPEDAFCVYKEAKESYIKSIASQYFSQGRITERVFKAMLRYQIEITD